jgi:hypothetical protein
LPFCDDLDSLLINVSGHLLLLSPMQSQVNGHEKSNGSNGEETVAEFQVFPIINILLNLQNSRVDLSFKINNKIKNV